MQNRRQFQGKVVLDVGTGSGILAMFAAKAGAKKVYAVEATSMADFARKLVAHNNMSNVIEVIQGTIETIELPEKVDIIISEWMGYFLIRESMLDSVVHARDRFLKPGGAMYPSHATIYMAPIRTQQAMQRMTDFRASMEGWAEFLGEMQRYYGINMDVLSDDFHSEQKDYFLSTSAWTDTHPSQMLGPPTAFKKYDLHTVTLEELKKPIHEDFHLHVVDGGPVEAFCGFFDTDFRGSAENPTDFTITLSTAPDPTGATHWGQQCFFLNPAIECAANDRLRCTIDVVRKKDNHRLLNVMLQVKTEGNSTYGEAPHSARTFKFHIE
jgi:protein arginine N-methyltransferase 1